MTTTTRQYVAIQQQLWMNESGHGVDYIRHGDPSTDRAALVAATVDELGHDDFNIATVEGGRLVAFGWDGDDFGPDEDGTPHGGHPLVEIARQTGLTT